MSAAERLDAALLEQLGISGKVRFVADADPKFSPDHICWEMDAPDGGCYYGNANDASDGMAVGAHSTSSGPLATRSAKLKGNQSLKK